MILVDSSIWIDHLRKGDPTLAELLLNDNVGSHPFVIEELAMGSLKDRDQVLSLLANLYQFPVVGHGELLHPVTARQLWGRGLTPIDAGLVGSVLLVDGESSGPETNACTPWPKSWVSPPSVGALRRSRR